MTSASPSGHGTANPLRGALVVGALGVVYGDIGTSPIYTLRECLKSAGDATGTEAVLGLLSLIFWALMIVVTAKRGAVAKSAEAPPPPPLPAKAAKAAIVTTKQLAGQLAESHELAPKQAQAVLDGVVGLLVEHLKAGDKLRLNGLGVLEVKDRPARMGRNPATGAAVQIAASKKIAFRPAKELKEAI